jgi:hypothetical protein
MDYKIYINDQLYKTVTTSDGYNYVEIMQDIQRDKDAGELNAFGINAGMSVKVEQQ